MLRTSISPQGRFIVARHSPKYRVANFRQQDALCSLGATDSGQVCGNAANFPAGDVVVEQAQKSLPKFVHWSLTHVELKG